jgi:hypothetical protein
MIKRGRSVKDQVRPIRQGSSGAKQLSPAGVPAGPDGRVGAWILLTLDTAAHLMNDGRLDERRSSWPVRKLGLPGRFHARGKRWPRSIQRERPGCVTINPWVGGGRPDLSIQPVERGVAAVVDSVGMMLADLTARYNEMPASEAFTRLYVDDEQFGHVFAILHERLNEHFAAINGRAQSTKHYWAESSREMLELIEELNEVLDILKTVGIEVVFTAEYRAAVDRCEPWLASSYGSEVPDDFERIRLIRYAPVFSRPETTARLKKRESAAELKMVGEGSYAIVFSYIDPDYGIRFAIKRAKKGLDERDLHRFKQEFKALKRL